MNHLNEPGIYHNLQKRYQQEEIYVTVALIAQTFVGDILLAVNPWKEQWYYGDEMMDSIKTSPKLIPHVYSVANLVYAQLTSSGVSQVILGTNFQSILVSGESGAGKTESAKYCLQYLTYISGWTSVSLCRQQ